VLNVIEQLPVATLAEQVSPAPSLTVTVPVGVPRPGTTGVTVKLIVTGWPATDGLGVCAVIVVVVLSWLTVCDSVEEVLPLKLESPAYAAVMLCGLPETDSAEVLNVATPEVNDPVPSVVAPSLNVTVPVGVPVLAVEASLTVAVNVTDCPKTDGSGEEPSAVVVFAVLTVWETGGLVLALKLLPLVQPAPVSV